jgi:hypothetical protein
VIVGGTTSGTAAFTTAVPKLTVSTYMSPARLEGDAPVNVIDVELFTVTVTVVDAPGVVPAKLWTVPVNVLLALENVSDVLAATGAVVRLVSVTTPVPTVDTVPVRPPDTVDPARMPAVEVTDTTAEGVCVAVTVSVKSTATLPVPAVWTTEGVAVRVTVVPLTLVTTYVAPLLRLPPVTVIPASIPAALTTVRVALVELVESVVTFPVVEPLIVTLLVPVSHAVVALLRVNPVEPPVFVTVVDAATPVLLPALVIVSPVNEYVDCVPRVADSADAVWLPVVVTLVAVVGKPVPVTA